MSSSSNTEATIKLDKAVYSPLCLMKLSCEMHIDKQSHMLVEIIKELLANNRIRAVFVTQDCRTSCKLCSQLEATHCKSLGQAPGVDVEREESNVYSKLVHMYICTF